MRRRRKVFYWVQNTGLRSSIWWVNGRGWVKSPDSGAMSNVKTCYTKRAAIRHCRRINAIGGRGHISMFFRKRGRRMCREMWIPGFVPWT